MKDCVSTPMSLDVVLLLRIGSSQFLIKRTVSNKVLLDYTIDSIDYLIYTNDSYASDFPTKTIPMS